MTNEQAIEILKEEWRINAELFGKQFDEALNVAIGALKRDKEVDDITFHWNDEKNNFVAACNAFEDILKVYGRGVSE